MLTGHSDAPVATTDGSPSIENGSMQRALGSPRTGERLAGLFGTGDSYLEVGCRQP